MAQPEGADHPPGVGTGQQGVADRDHDGNDAGGEGGHARDERLLSSAAGAANVEDREHEQWDQW